MSMEEALKLLKEYGCIQLKIAQSPEEEEALRQAILLVNQRTLIMLLIAILT